MTNEKENKKTERIEAIKALIEAQNRYQNSQTSYPDIFYPDELLDRIRTLDESEALRILEEYEQQTNSFVDYDAIIEHENGNDKVRMKFFENGGTLEEIAKYIRDNNLAVDIICIADLVTGDDILEYPSELEDSDVSLESLAKGYVENKTPIEEIPQHLLRNIVFIRDLIDYYSILQLSQTRRLADAIHSEGEGR